MMNLVTKQIKRYHNSRNKFSTLGKPTDIEWGKLIHNSYRYWSSGEYYLPDHVYVRDTDQIIECKEQAAEKAYNMVFSEIKREAEQRNSEILDDDDESFCSQESLNMSGAKTAGEKYMECCPSASSLRAFSRALPFCYPLTFHLMCNGWSTNCQYEAILECPLCPNMDGWRKKYKIVDIIGYKDLCSHHQKKNAGKQNPNGLRCHLKSYGSDRYFHRIIIHYLNNCQLELPKVTQCFITSFKHGVVYDANVPPIRHPYIPPSPPPYANVFRQRNEDMKDPPKRGKHHSSWSKSPQEKCSSSRNTSTTKASTTSGDNYSSNRLNEDDRKISSTNEVIKKSCWGNNDGWPEGSPGEWCVSKGHGCWGKNQQPKTI